ncbi:MAG TPA: XrtA/PEP-CTERM system histidine kinase PrsK [Croceibacterium sp.]|nr:XrtA/PEP-CTERM system histidine kinase PrsK [Croceibacterium sp.]
MIGALSAVMALVHLLCAGFALAAGGWILSRRQRHGPVAIAQAAVMALMACWAMAVLVTGGASITTAALFGLLQLAWLWMLYRLFGQDLRDRGVGLVRPVVLSLALVEMLQFALLLAAHNARDAASIQAIAGYSEMFRLLFCIGGLVLVHNLYAGASQQTRQALGWPAAALALVWLYELNFSTITWLHNDTPEILRQLRGGVMLAAAGMLAIGGMRHDDNLRFGPSRSFAFQSFSLLVIAAYFIAMMLVSRGLTYAGGEFARAAQIGFLALAGAIALAVLPSRRLRGWLKVTITKHLFQHRYDYRAEWLRFTSTMGRAGPDSPPLGQRIVQAVADVADSPGGLLLTPDDEGGLALEARWQWPDVDVPAQAFSRSGARFCEQSQFVIDLDDLRGGRAEGIPASAHPEWLMQETVAWAIVPLLHYERLVGVVVLSRPAIARRLDWEDFDLLRVVGRQVASYLAEQASHDALGEARRFDEFNRRIAFVMHDIKNLASQLSLLARNAEKHAENPAFRADMLVTLRNSSDKLQTLLARLGRYGQHGGDALTPVALDDILSRIADRYRGQHEVIVVEYPGCTVTADRDGLEQALVHLVQNGIDASPPGSPVFLDARVVHSQAIIAVVDSGAGMSPEFVRSQLFKPFHSSKAGGFGIGAFEARELVRGMRGKLEVESREGLGTRFIVRLTLAGGDASQEKGAQAA